MAKTYRNFQGKLKISSLITSKKQVGLFVFLNFVVNKHSVFRLLAFDEHTIERFESCKIGRSVAAGEFKIRERLDETPTKNVNLDSMQMKEMPEREDCGKNVNVLEANAAKFGDTPNSHVVYILQDTFWKKDFNLEFDFRTFYGNGMLLFSKVFDSIK